MEARWVREDREKANWKEYCDIGEDHTEAI